MRFLNSENNIVFFLAKSANMPVSPSLPPKDFFLTFFPILILDILYYSESRERAIQDDVFTSVALMCISSWTEFFDF